MFGQIYWVFLVLGTLVGIVVIGYMLWKAYAYRDQGEEVDEAGRPELGELPQGAGGGRKLFVSFILSTVIVVTLIAWTYGTLLYVEAGPPQDADGQLEIEVVGFQFGWQFIYTDVEGHEAGVESTGELVVPVDTAINLRVTSTDVFHNFGVPELRVKGDAIPGTYTEQWFIADETGEHTAFCYELCGTGHSYMTANVVVMSQEDFDDWYADQQEDGG